MWQEKGVNNNQLYVPSFGEWSKFYDQIGKHRKPSAAKSTAKSGNFGASNVTTLIDSLPTTSKVPTFASDQRDTSHRNQPVKLDFVSATENAVQQAVSEMKKSKIPVSKSNASTKRKRSASKPAKKKRTAGKQKRKRNTSNKKKSLRDHGTIFSTESRHCG